MKFIERITPSIKETQDLKEKLAKAKERRKSLQEMINTAKTQEISIDESTGQQNTIMPVLISRKRKVEKDDKDSVDTSSGSKRQCEREDETNPSKMQI